MRAALDLVQDDEPALVEFTMGLLQPAETLTCEDFFEPGTASDVIVVLLSWFCDDCNVTILKVCRRVGGFSGLLELVPSFKPPCKHCAFPGGRKLTYAHFGPRRT